MIGYLSDERDWSKVLDGAATIAELREGVKGWAPFVDDAQSVVDGMDDAALAEFRAGLQLERKGEWAGEEFQIRFGALLLPARLMEGSVAAAHYKVPLGTALIQMQKAGVLK